jgi:hypothetical protein
VHKGTGSGNTGLAAVEEEVLRVVLQRVLNVRISEDEGRGLAAELEGDTLEVAIPLLAVVL